MARKYDPEVGGAENFPTIIDLKSDYSRQDAPASDRQAKDQHNRLKDVGYTSWPYDEQAVQDYEEMERQHKGSSGL